MTMPFSAHFFENVSQSSEGLFFALINYLWDTGQSGGGPSSLAHPFYQIGKFLYIFILDFKFHLQFLSPFVCEYFSLLAHCCMFCLFVFNALNSGEIIFGDKWPKTLRPLGWAAGGRQKEKGAAKDEMVG